MINSKNPHLGIDCAQRGIHCFAVPVKMGEGPKYSCHLASSTASFFNFPVACSTANLINNTHGMA